MNAALQALVNQKLFNPRDVARHSYSANQAMITLTDNGELSNDEYARRISEILGSPIKAFPEDHLTHYTYRYLIAEVIKAYTPNGEGPFVPVDALYRKAKEKAATYIDENQYIFARPEGDAPKLNADGSLAPKKGDKRVMAIEWFAKNNVRILQLPKSEQRKTAIAELVKEVQLTEAGASTYWANLKSGVMK